MAETPITITAGNVIPSVTSGHSEYVCGEALSAGDLVYAYSATTVKKAVNTTGPAATAAAAIGMMLTSGATNQVGLVALTGQEITCGSVFTGKGHQLVLSGTAGKMMEASDLSTDVYVTRIGYSTAATKIVLDIKATGLKFNGT